MSKRKQFRRLRDLQDNLKKYNAFSVNGYFPLFNTIDDVIAVSPVSSYHTHEFEGVEYYMPDGLEMGKNQFHGDYDGQITPETTAQTEVMETPETIEMPEEEPEQTYTPPPISRLRDSEEGGGY